ncbi:hypothetical protein E4U23_004561 [Claviceps purpurea]|nr:hypothetical protein E4U23_004561 [Claviceps purpurea]
MHLVLMIVLFDSGEGFSIRIFAGSLKNFGDCSDGGGFGVGLSEVENCGLRNIESPSRGPRELANLSFPSFTPSRSYLFKSRKVWGE